MDPILPHIGLVARQFSACAACLSIQYSVAFLVSNDNNGDSEGCLHLDQQLPSNPARILCHTFLLSNDNFSVFDSC